MNDTKYNGWTNYETWRVNLEIFDGLDPFDHFSDNQADIEDNLAEYLKDYADEIIFANCRYDERGQPSLMEDYARAFLQNVNWHEIAKNMITDYAEV